MTVRLLASIALTAVAMAALAVARAERLPTDVELKAAYCLKVIQLFTIPFAEQARSEMKSVAPRDQLSAPANAKIDTTMKAEINKGRDSEARLQLYLLSRMPDLDPVPIIVAMKQGELDAAGFRQSLAKCFAECAVSAPGDSMWSAASKCGGDCVRRLELAPRVATCGNLNWLLL
jgi:hypothetical protein